MKTTPTLCTIKGLFHVAQIPQKIGFNVTKNLDYKALESALKDVILAEDQYRVCELLHYTTNPVPLIKWRPIQNHIYHGISLP